VTLLAIDPGPTQSGFVVFGEGVIHSGVLPNDQMRLYMKINCHNGELDRLAIEMIASYGMAVGAEVFNTCLWIGRYLEYWEKYNEPSTAQLVFRREVKMHLCGTARAKDTNIKQALVDKLGPIGKKDSPGPLYGVKSHAWPALGVAITALNL
jgi:hypothetical protein